MIRIFVFLLASVTAADAEEVYVGAYRQWNQGSTIFEIGSRYPDITGVASGSRITYPRNFATTGFLMSLYMGAFQAVVDVHHTGAGVKSGTGRDEDFVMSLNSRQEGSKINVAEGKFRDNQYVFSGGRNFADSYGKTALQEYGSRLTLRYFPAGKAEAVPRARSWFLGADGTYSYSKYVIYDSVQYNSPSLLNAPFPFTLLPIGRGLSFTSVAFEIIPGAGFQQSLSDGFGFAVFLGPVLGFEESRDYHNLRGITFFMANAGAGFYYKAELLAHRDRFVIRLSASGHRRYSRGTIHARGLDPIYNVLPPQRMYLGTKEWTARIAVEYKI